MTTTPEDIAALLADGAIPHPWPYGTGQFVALVLDGCIQATVPQEVLAEAKQIRAGRGRS